MKIEIKKSEVAVLKQALKHHAWLIYNDKCILDKEVHENPLSKKYKISLLKKIAMIEHRLIDELFINGYHKKRTGNSHCWWLWTDTDKNWKKTGDELNSKWVYNSNINRDCFDIKNLNLSIRVWSILSCAGIKTIPELVYKFRTDPKSFLRYRQFGRMSLIELTNKIKELI